MIDFEGTCVDFAAYISFHIPNCEHEFHVIYYHFAIFGFYF